MRLRLFRPQILVVNVRLNGLTLDEEEIVDRLVGIHRGIRDGLLPLIHRATAAIVTSVDAHANWNGASLSSDRPTLSAIHLHVPVARSEVVDWADGYKAVLAAAVIRDTDYRSSDPKILESLLTRNVEINRKGGFRRLIDKQGALLVSSATEPQDSETLSSIVSWTSRRWLSSYCGSSGCIRARVTLTPSCTTSFSQRRSPGSTSLTAFFARA